MVKKRKVEDVLMEERPDLYKITVSIVENIVNHAHVFLSENKDEQKKYGISYIFACIHLLPYFMADADLDNKEIDKVLSLIKETAISFREKCLKE